MSSQQNSKGKNFSCNNSSGKRKKSDFYETPYSITRHLLSREFFDCSSRVLEPASGNGAITKVLKEKFDHNNITEYDLVTHGTDFLKEEKQFSYIITNPPFSLAYEFVSKAKEIATTKFAFLLPLSYLHGQKRYHGIYQDRDYGLKKIYVFTRYPMLGEPLRKDGKYNTGMMVYGWYIWEKGWNQLPSIDWIDNNDDIVKKGK